MRRNLVIGSSIDMRVSLIVAAAVFVAVFLPASVAVIVGAPGAWTDQSFVVSAVLAALAVVVVAWLAGRAAARVVLEPLRRTIGRLEAVASGERAAVPPSGGATEIGRIEEAVMEIVDSAWERERRYATTVGALAHDVRLSLAAVKGVMDPLVLDDEGASVTLSSSVARAVREEIERLQAMTSDLVVLMRPRVDAPDAGSMPVSPIVLEVARAVMVTTGREIVVNVTKEFDRPLPRQVVERLFRNLLQNAATAARERVVVEVLEGLVTISDDGPGFGGRSGPWHGSRDLHRHQPVYSAQPQHGFGFDIACRLAELAGGKVVIEHSSSAGTRLLVYV